LNDILLRIVISIISAIAGAISSLFLKELVDFLKSRDGELSGEWIQIIYDKNGSILKKDIVECYHLGDRLQGTIQRLEPSTDKYRKWTFEGKILDDLFFGTFLTTDRRRNPGSYGTLQLRKVIFQGETTLEGFYIKSDSQLGSRKGNLEKSFNETSLKWERARSK
jgi:hypothetical protein